MKSTSYDYDLLVIGSGPGGYVAAIRASQKGLKTGVVERDALGGICLNWGCIPSKALLKNATLMHEFNRAEEFGFKVSGLTFDFKKIIQRSREVAEINSKGVDYLFKKNKISIVEGNGVLFDEHTVEVTTKDGKSKKKVTADKIIVATGGRARTFPGVEFDGKKIITYKEAMTLPKQPKKLVVIGAGAIGVAPYPSYRRCGNCRSVRKVIQEAGNQVVHFKQGRKAAKILQGSETDRSIRG
jgi:dihydrolipoamide dehydrogenase